MIKIIVISIVISIIILLIVFKNNTPLSNKKYGFLENALIAFNIKKQEHFENDITTSLIPSSSTTSNEIVFKSILDFDKYLEKFVLYLYPKINYDEIDKLAIKYNLFNKKAKDIINQQNILLANKTKSWYNNLEYLLLLNEIYMFMAIDNLTIDDVVLLTTIHPSAKIISMELPKEIKITYDKTESNPEEIVTYTLEKIYLKTNKDYETTNYLKIYYYNNLNENIPENEAIQTIFTGNRIIDIMQYDKKDACKLYYNKIKLTQDGYYNYLTHVFPNINKNNIEKNKDLYKLYFNTRFIKWLCILSEIYFTTELNNDIDRLANELFKKMKLQTVDRKTYATDSNGNGVLV